MNLFPSDAEWDAFCAKAEIPSDRAIELQILSKSLLSPEELGIVNEDERYMFEVFRAERNNTDLPVGVMWDQPYDL